MEKLLSGKPVTPHFLKSSIIKLNLPRSWEQSTQVFDQFGCVGKVAFLNNRLAILSKFEVLQMETIFTLKVTPGNVNIQSSIETNLFIK